MSLNITHCVETLHRGGLEHVVLDLVTQQQAQGHKCQVICLFDGGLLVERFESIGVPVHVCKKRSGLDLRAAWRMRRHIRAHATDVLHTHNRTAHYYAVLATLGSRPTSVVCTSHGMGASGESDRREKLFALCVPRTDRIVAVSEMVRRRMLERGIPAEKLTVAHNGIDVAEYAERNAQSGARLRRELGLGDNVRVLGTVGRLNRLKDPATLIRAFAELHARHSDTVLLMVGDGSLRAEMQALVAELDLAADVKFLGDREDVADLLAGMDMFVMSSISEGFSIALLEACACSLPVVATHVGGNPEIITDGINGRLVAASDPGALAAAMLEVLDDPQCARRLGEAGRAWVMKNATLTAMAAGYAEIYAESHRGTGP